MGEDNVVYLDIETTADVSVPRVLETEHFLKTAIVIGWDQEGQFYASSSTSDLKEIVFLLKLFETNLMSGAYNQ